MATCDHVGTGALAGSAERSSGDVLNCLQNYGVLRRIDCAVTVMTSNTVISEMIPSEMAQYKHHTPRTSFSMWVRYSENASAGTARTSIVLYIRLNARIPSKKYPAMPICATGMPCNMAYGLWLTIPQSQWSL